ncbi:hypothetical protein OOZ51_00335 [Arthrobacter sp. MI7-26]|uniref:hypothetical protein n=1 Tax=Arthrobacter sp. MI7-26 TaxID=2993653 RepID=UPI0022488A64|nr:hypothetical protein [Arthrobacter sp. MI7-26]MCX2746260.1 hypothetical protein [Arthrobacter sp. MI7-26]
MVKIAGNVPGYTLGYRLTQVRASKDSEKLLPFDEESSYQANQFMLIRIAKWFRLE